MKAISIGLVAVLTVLVVVFVDSTPQGSAMIQPEGTRVNDYTRPVKDGNCYIQTDSAGNKIRVCG